METRTIILGQDGRHVTLGRSNVPTADEIARVAATLKAQGLTGWQAELAGAYYGTGRVVLREVALLAGEGDFGQAAVAFHRLRRAAQTG